MRIQHKLIFAFLMIAVLISIAGYVGVSELGLIASAFYYEKDYQFPAYSSLSTIQAILPLILLEPSEYINEPDEEHVEELDEAEEHIHDALLVYEQSERNEMVSSFRQDVDELFMLSREIIRLKDHGAPSDTVQQYFGQLDDKLELFAEKLEAEQKLLAEDLDTSGETLKRDIQFTFNLTAILTAIAAIIAIVIGIYTSRSVSIPISKLKDAADQIGKGNFDVTTKFWKSDDEIGQLCNHFDTMKDQLKNKEEMQKEFMSIASHELRTPIQPILGYAELATRGIMKTDDALKIIVKEAKRLQRLANDILDVTRIESNRIRYTMESVDLNNTLSSVIESRVSLKKDVAFQTRIIATEGIHIFGDKERMIQVLNNVIGNSMKFTTKGEIRIESNYLKDDSKVRITISDTGIGLPPELIPKLFGKFVTKNVKNENQQGSGLGLFISRAIVDAHNGHISAHNNDNGVGAAFVITLPVHFISDVRRDKMKSKNLLPSAVNPSVE